MTTLRFVGDLPLWLGLVLALFVGAMSWRYYRRESFDLPHRLKWLLPLLRSLAFFLGIMLLTGPVLHHRTVIGELGRVKIFVDGSNSMTLFDRHMDLDRKLKIAEQLGWMPNGTVDTSAAEIVKELSTARKIFAAQLSDKEIPEEKTLQRTAETFNKQLKNILPKLPATVQASLQADVLAPIENVMGNPSDETRIEQLTALLAICETLEEVAIKRFEESLQAGHSQSQSIQTALSLFDETPRWRRAELGLKAASANVLKQIREKHDVEVVRLTGVQTESDQLFEHAANTEKEAPVQFSNITDLSSGIVVKQQGRSTSQNSESSTPQPETAIVLLSDGQHNSGPSPQQTARVLGSQGGVFYCVSFGASAQAPDIAVVGIEYPELVFQKDQVRGVITVRDRMPLGKPMVVQITHADQVLWQQQLLTQNVSERKIEFEFEIDKLVENFGSQFTSDIQQHALPLKFEASIAPLADEAEVNNNRRSFQLAAITQSYKVLLIDGRSRWETRYLRNVFERDEQWSIDTVIAGATTDDAVLPRGKLDNHFPDSRDSLFEYDLVIFGEIAPELFQEHEFMWLREFVEVRGGGMVFIDGHRGLLKQLDENSLGSLLPISWRAEQFESKPVSFQLSEKGAQENALKLSIDDEANRRLWSELPPPHSMLAVDALPGAEVLLEVNVAGVQQPAMVTHSYGAGRVLYLAFDETWRWRYKVADVWHQRIWNQLAKYVMPRPFAVSDEYLSLDTGSVSYESGETVPVRVRLLGLDGKPLNNATADAMLWKDGRIVSTIHLTSDADVPGMYHGLSGEVTEGSYEVSVRASGFSDAVLKARTQFDVLSPESGEMVETAANETLLEQMAAASGGMSLREEELYKLPELLNPLSSGRVVESDTQIGQSYWWFTAIILLLTLEWILRKRTGLL